MKINPFMIRNLDNVPFQLWQILLDDIPDQNQIHAKILMCQKITGCGNLLPWCFRV